MKWIFVKSYFCLGLCLWIGWVLCEEYQKERALQRRLYGPNTASVMKPPADSVLLDAFPADSVRGHPVPIVDSIEKR